MNDMMKVAILIVLICVDAVLLLTAKRGGRRRSGFDNREGTVIIPYLYLEQLDPFNLTKCHRRFNMTQDQLLSTGVTITSAGKSGDIPLDCAFQETMTVGQEHAVVAMDEYGCFIQNCHANGMYVPGSEALERVEEVEIADGTVVYLGRQPIRFRYPQIRQATRSTPWTKALVVIRTIMGSLMGFAGKRRKPSASRRSSREDW